ncbi:MAG: helix-turn-helix domain-containing protein [Ruminococcaceae bacterium]|nr:helix-turn-helix domain-containing protein [Oscillospiraceae bacterium]
MRFIQLLFHTYPTIIEADTVLHKSAENEAITIEQSDKTITFLLSTDRAYDISDAEHTVRLDSGSIVVLFPKKQYQITPASNDVPSSEYSVMEIRAVIPDLSFWTYDTDAGHTLTYATQYDIDNLRLLLSEYIRPDEKTYQAILVSVVKLMNHYYANTVSERYFAVAKWYEIAAHIDICTRSALRIHQEKTRIISSTPSNGRYIRLVKQYVKEHYHEYLSVPLIASELKITPNYLSTIYKKETGVSITNYINSYRIYQLRELLCQNSDASLSELCLSVGLQDKRYTQRLFKKYFGVSVQDFKKIEESGNRSAE